MNLELRSKFLVLCKEDLFFFFVLTIFHKFLIFQGPFESDYPAKLEATVRDGPVRCISFNRRGTMLAGGCSDGYCIIWDFQSMSIIRKMRCHVSSVTSVR
jgi:WD40 repeat protein